MGILRKIAVGALIGMIAEHCRKQSLRRPKLPEVRTWTKVSDESDPANY